MGSTYHGNPVSTIQLNQKYQITHRQHDIIHKWSPLIWSLLIWSHINHIFVFSISHPKSYIQYQYHLRYSSLERLTTWSTFSPLTVGHKSDNYCNNYRFVYRGRPLFIPRIRIRISILISIDIDHCRMKIDENYRERKLIIIFNDFDIRFHSSYRTYCTSYRVHKVVNRYWKILIFH